MVDGYIGSSYINTYGIRKGTATYSTSDTTVPPSLIKVALCGEWRMEKRFDLCFNFGECGNIYQFRNEMKPILCLMEQSLLMRTSDRNLIDMDLESSFTCRLEYVKENLEYILQIENGLIELHYIFVRK